MNFEHVSRITAIDLNRLVKAGIIALPTLPEPPSTPKRAPLVVSVKSLGGFTDLAKARILARRRKS